MKCNSCVFRHDSGGPTVHDVSSAAAHDPSAATRPGRRLALAGLSLVMLLSSLGTGVANVALPTLEDRFAASFGQVRWVVLAYLLAVTTLVVGAGRLGDVTGRRRLLTVGVAVFSAASAICAAAPSLWVLVGARALQGIGAAAMMALSLALVTEAVPESRTGSAMGLLGSASALGTALGPSLGGLLIAGPGWRAIFLVNVPLGLAAIHLVRRHVLADRPGGAGVRRGLDAPGTLLLVGVLAAYALSMTLSGGPGGPAGLALLGLAAGGTVVLGLVERRSREPLIDPSVLRDRVLAPGLVTSGIVSTVMMATLVVGPFHLARALALGPFAVGLAMSLGPAVVAMSGIPVGRLVDRHGVRRVTLAGLGAMTAGTLPLAVAPLRLGLPGYLGPIVMVTLGYALFQTANNAAVMAAAGGARRGVVSGMLNLSRNLGLITGASVMGAVFALGSGAGDTRTATPEAVATGTHVTFGVATALLLVALGRVRRVSTRPSRTG